jgi:hypothetical protein
VHNPAGGEREESKPGSEAESNQGATRVSAFKLGSVQVMATQERVERVALSCGGTRWHRSGVEVAENRQADYKGRSSALVTVHQENRDIEYIQNNVFV